MRIVTESKRFLTHDFICSSGAFRLPPVIKSLTIVMQVQSMRHQSVVFFDFIR